MWISHNGRAELEKVYLHRGEEPTDPLNAWVCFNGLSLALTLAEIPRLIAALDEAMEKAEEIPANARGTVWETRPLRLEPSGEASASETP